MAWNSSDSEMLGTLCFPRENRPRLDEPDDPWSANTKLMAQENTPRSGIPRRKFIQISAAGVGAVGALTPMQGPGAEPIRARAALRRRPAGNGQRPYNGAYAGEYLNRVAFPMGGIGAGMICLEGTGALSHVSLRNHPEVFNEPCAFAALGIKGHAELARVLEGPVPSWKLFGTPGSGNGEGGTSFGLPRFTSAVFEARFPFATIKLRDDDLPLEVEITGWSPFEPGDPDAASLPVAGLEYRLTNRSGKALEAVFSFNAKNFMAAGQNPQAVRPVEGGFILWGGAGKDRPWEEGAFSATVSDPGVKVNHGWFRGGWWDSLTMAWKDVEAGASYDRAPYTEGGHSPGATLFVPLQLGPGESKRVTLRLAWYSGRTNLRIGKDPAGLKDTAAGPLPAVVCREVRGHQWRDVLLARPIRGAAGKIEAVQRLFL